MQVVFYGAGHTKTNINGYITNCINYGNVYGEFIQNGGIAGVFHTIGTGGYCIAKNTINYGTVSGGGTLGNLIGNISRRNR